MSDLFAYTPDQVSRVTGLTRRQLSYWDKTGFFSPHFTGANRPCFRQMYSFEDVVGLRTVANLRHRLPLQELRRIGAWLHERYEEPWATLRFFVVGRQVVFEDPIGHRAVAGSDQVVLPVRLVEVEREVSDAAEALLVREPGQVAHITRNRFVQHNAWVLDGTRIPTSAVWDFHQAGYDRASIQKEYPRLTLADVEAAIEFERRRATTRAG
ncbi:MAG: DUF433 domain-containing protein [Chloroflexi bacterium]|nr:DUF433 domain-containing protein [Chloroflexota bacterium]